MWHNSVEAGLSAKNPLIARLMGPTWGPSGTDRTQVGPILAPWTLLSGSFWVRDMGCMLWALWKNWSHSMKCIPPEALMHWSGEYFTSCIPITITKMNLYRVVKQPVFSLWHIDQSSIFAMIGLGTCLSSNRYKVMMTSSNVNIFRVTGSLCGEFTGPSEFPAQRPVTRSFDVFFDLRLNKRLSKQPWGWWFETPSWSLWRHCISVS